MCFFCYLAAQCSPGSQRAGAKSAAAVRRPGLGPAEPALEHAGDAAALRRRGPSAGGVLFDSSSSTLKLANNVK